MSLFGLAVWKTAFELSPIFLTGGNSWISQTVGSTVPIILLTEPLSIISSLASGGENKELDGFFAHWVPLSGTTIIDNQVATYPFANQGVAANAVIAQPLQVSMQMICPVKAPFGYPLKLATFTILQQQLADHSRSGGTYTVLTPSYMYTNCLLTRVVDVSGGESNQRQHTWQFDFIQPLLTVESAIAQGNTNPLTTAMNNGGQIDNTTLTSPSNALTGIDSAPGAAGTGYGTSGGMIGPNPTGASLGSPAGDIGGDPGQVLPTVSPVLNPNQPLVPGGAVIDVSGGASVPGSMGPLP